MSRDFLVANLVANPIGSRRIALSSARIFNDLNQDVLR
jgi:hypothetical protein